MPSPKPPLRLALKIDVDTFEGMRQGVPFLLSLLKKHDIRASFFIPFGPDHSGRAVGRIFRHTGFSKKMLRTRALATYGWRTILSGTVFPGRFIGPSFPHLLRQIEEEDHELGLHGYDHVYWHDHLHTLSEKEVQEEFLRGVNAFQLALGRSPAASAAPGWQCSFSSLRTQEELGLTYHSDTRGSTPYFPVVNGHFFTTLEIPTTLPTWDELWNQNSGSENTMVTELFSLLEWEKLNVLTIHAEIEGNAQIKPFEIFLQKLVEFKTQFVRLEDVAQKLLQQRHKIPHLSIRSETIPGRAGTVCCAVPS